MRIKILWLVFLSPLLLANVAKTATISKPKIEHKDYQLINNVLNLKTPTWDEVIKPQLIKRDTQIAEANRIAKAKSDCETQNGSYNGSECVLLPPPAPAPEIIQSPVTVASNDVWAQLRQCEAGGDYTNKHNPNYRGAYQFDFGTWGNYGGYYDPADAPPAVQDAAAQALQARRGWSPWPQCAAKLGLL